MAVAFDAVGPAGGAGVTGTTSIAPWAHINSAAGNAIIVGITYTTGTTPRVTAVTYGAVSLTRLTTIPSGNTGPGGLEIWTKIGGLPTGSNNVSVSFPSSSDAVTAGSLTLSGVTGFGTAQTAVATSATALSLTHTGTTSGNLLVVTSCNGNGSYVYTTNSPGTTRFSRNGDSNSAADNIVCATYASPGGSQSVGFTTTGGAADHWSLVSIEAQAGAAAPVLPVLRIPYRPAIPSRPPASQIISAPSVAAPSAITLADVAGAADSLVVTAAVPLPERGAGVEAPSAAVTLAVTDSAGAGDVATVPARTLPLPEQAAASEAITVTAAVPSADVAGGADTLAATATVPLADAAAAAEVATAAVSLPLAERGAAADAVSVAVPKMETLTDAFPGSSVDASKWGPFGTATVSGGVLSLTDTASSTAGAGGVASAARYDLTGSYLFAQLASAGTQYATTQAVLMAYLDAANTAALIVNNGSLIAQHQTASSYTTDATVAYSATTHKWLRIRESGGTVFYDCSADSITWSNLASVADPWAVTSLQAIIQESQYGGTDPAATSQWASVNLSQAALADAAGGADSLAVTVAAVLAEAGAGADQQAVSAAVPEADRAGAADQVTVTVTAALVETAAGSETFTVTATLAVADVAAAPDQPTVSASVPLAETGTGAEASAATATVPLAEQAGAVEYSPRELYEAAGAAESFSVVVGAVVAYADAAGAAEQLASPAAVPLAEAAGAKDQLAVAVAATVADAGGGSDQTLVSAATPLAEVAAAAESQLIGVAPVDAAAAAEQLAVTVLVPVADAAGAADTVSVQSGTVVTLADAGAAAEQVAVSVASPAADAGAVTEQLTGSVTAGVSDRAGAADAIAVVVGATPQLAEAGAATDSAAVTSATGLGDQAGAAEAISVAGAASIALADQAAAADAPGVSTNLPLPDAAAAAEALAVVRTAQPVLPDAAGGTEAYSASVVTARGDVAAASESLTVVPLLSISLTDRAGAAEQILISIPPAVPVPAWEVGPLVPRWQVTAAGPSWQVDAAGLEWETVLIPPRWEVSAARAEWRIVMAEFEPVASISKEAIPVLWTSDLGGAVTDPTAMAVQFAFPASSGDPAHPATPSTWFPGTWVAPVSGGYKGFIAQAVIGPVAQGGLIQLTAGRYDVWSSVTTPDETPRRFAGVLTVY